MTKRIITYGTFDLLHIGHINLLRRARNLGDYLIVGLSTDEFNVKKHKESFSSYEDREIILRSIRYVDQVIPESSWEQKMNDVHLHSIDTFVIGDDWQGEFDFLREHCEVVYLPRTEGISTSGIKNSFS